MSGDELRELIDRAAAALDLGRPQVGIPFALRAVALAPADGRALGWLALLYLRSDLFEQGLDAAERAVAVDPESEWAHRLRGIALRGLGRSEAAAEALAEAVRVAPTEPLALTTFAWYASEVGRAREAFAAAGRAVELYPDQGRSWFSLGWSAWALKRWDVAESALRRDRALRPDDSVVHNNLGALYAKRKRFTEALECFERSLELNPRSVYAYRNSAYCLRSLGRWDAAAALHERDLSNKLDRAEETLRRTRSASALTIRAFVYRSLGRFGDAAADLEEALQLANGRHEIARPLRSLAIARLLLGEDEASREVAERLLRDYPDDSQSLSIASWVGWLVGDRELAARSAQIAAERKLDPAGVASRRAEAALAAGAWGRAVRHLVRYWQLSRTIAQCCSHAEHAVALHNLGDERAAEAFEEARRASPGCITLRAVRDRFDLPVA